MISSDKALGWTTRTLIWIPGACRANVLSRHYELHRHLNFVLAYRQNGRGYIASLFTFWPPRSKEFCSHFNFVPALRTSKTQGDMQPLSFHLHSGDLQDGKSMGCTL